MKTTLNITIETDNEAFSDNAGEEVGRILTKLAGSYRVYGKALRSKLMDYNGNTVGKVEVKE